MVAYPTKFPIAPDAERSEVGTIATSCTTDSILPRTTKTCPPGCIIVGVFTSSLGSHPLGSERRVVRPEPPGGGQLSTAATRTSPEAALPQGGKSVGAKSQVAAQGAHDPEGRSSVAPTSRRAPTPHRLRRAPRLRLKPRQPARFHDILEESAQDDRPETARGKINRTMWFQPSSR